ncbi:5-(carboxyamino)imidazole ribonucleotide synthase [Qingshengfaniella alkalisoli]|uniref:N5-carboxyaminoimidazole ribonucleotide synthase n=1 Tax=Qingshengfaniella alkalisoli TaxID=2599296 RepID=A0A5B8J2H6_9RHOB|nr:5-(carboxyamino)imidazole ribonucleotide synthase [Qingshengfaniella alkalisoli]QDY68450.1 5-(carboxyamino)imidazole ribonucleotide synthase [Qingshengfaniella alkalisoli]
MTDLLPPGSTVGILGGGQLGRMMALAAARLGLKCHIYDPDPMAPAGQVCDQITTAPYDDKSALEAFAQSVDVVTYEFENIPTDALDLIEAIRPIRPNRRALATSQDRLTEKTFLNELGLKTAPFAVIDSAGDLESALATTGTPAILKTRRFGYDGKGQARVMTTADGDAAYASLKGAPAIAEGFVEFSCEISVIGARSLDGSVVCFDPGMNAHSEGILRRTTVPAPLPNALRTDAVLLAGRILNALDYVGVIGVELFVTPTGLVVNEIAPRVHNSGHWTQNGCAICQFEQHIRAVAGWPLGDGQRHSDVEMINLIGDDIGDLPRHQNDPSSAIHLYGKAETRPGRKMGHVNRIVAPKG